MVNEQKNIRHSILQLLYDAKGRTVSGVSISNELGVSRVAVWKHISALKKNGFDIESNAKGYVLQNHEDLLLPFCFDTKFQDRIFHFQHLDSTMNKAKSLAKENIPHLSVVLAENQTSGRGRLNRQWFSSGGGLWFTLILKPDIPPVLAYVYNFAAGLSLARTIKNMFSLDVSVKWPNDLLLEGRKLCGLLSEMETQGDMIEFVNIGIGLNVNNDPVQHEPNAVSLKQALGKNISRKLILQNFLDDFSGMTKDPDPAGIIFEWKKHTSTIGTCVRVETLKSVHKGMAVDVDETGALIIEDRHGKQKRIIYGDCFHNEFTRQA